MQQGLEPVVGIGQRAAAGSAFEIENGIGARPLAAGVNDCDRQVDVRAVGIGAILRYGQVAAGDILAVEYFKRAGAVMPAQGCIRGTVVVVPLLGKGGGTAAGEEDG